MLSAFCRFSLESNALRLRAHKASLNFIQTHSFREDTIQQSRQQFTPGTSLEYWEFSLSRMHTSHEVAP